MREWIADRRLRWVLASTATAIALFLVVLGAFPWGMLRGTIERKASAAIGRPVSIGSIERLDTFSFTPILGIRDVRVPQAAWAGDGDLARVREAKVRFSAWAVLAGRFAPLGVEIDGLRLALARRADRRVNWRNGPEEDEESGSSSALRHLVLHDARVTYRDAYQKRAYDLTLASDARGFRVTGTGAVAGHPVSVSAQGPAVAGDGRWPFEAAIQGDALQLRVTGAMDAPLDIHHLTLDVAARAADLKLIDAVIEVGLFGTQPVDLTAHARRDGRDWRIERLAGLVGGTHIAGQVTVKRAGGRNTVDGSIVADGLKFNDFASNAVLAEAAALKARQGERIVPNARVNIRTITHTDINMTFNARSIVDPGNAAFTAMHGKLALDHQLLIADPFVVTMRRGALSGRVRIDQRGGRPVPIVSIDVAIRDSTVGTIAGTGGGQVDARFDGVAHLVGPGSTIREAVGNSDGRIGLLARDGALPARIASMIGFDAGRSLFTGKDEQAGLRCLVLGLDMKHGRGTADPFVIDTTRSQSTGSGTLTFPEEAIALTLSGRPKDKIVLRLPGTVNVGGTIKAPDIVVPKEVKSVGNIFKAIGRAIRGDQGPLASDADCAGLAARVLR